MLTENDVVRAVAKYLKNLGYRVESALTTNEHGIDIVALNLESGKRMLVEAKGGTSSKVGTARFGKPFTRKQAKTHVSVALYSAAKLQEERERGTLVALAFPEDTNHKSLVEDIKTTLETLKISVFFVDSELRVKRFGSATQEPRRMK